MEIAHFRYKTKLPTHIYQLLTFESGHPQTEAQGYIKVSAIDGLFMATQYDIKWREDLLDGFHFYDVSQCFEFAQQG